MSIGTQKTPSSPFGRKRCPCGKRVPLFPLETGRSFPTGPLGETATQNLSSKRDVVSKSRPYGKPCPTLKGETGVQFPDGTSKTKLRWNSSWMGVRTESWTVKRSGLEVRMYSREKVELFLLATEDGMGPTAAAKFAGVSVGAAKKWATGHLPHSYTGARCRIGARKPPRKEASLGPRQVDLRPARDRPARRAQRGPDREPAAQGGVGRPKSGRVGPGFDLEQEQVRARREIEAGDRPAPPLDHRFLEDIEELL